MKTDPVCYYYRCPETGIEMNFTKSGGYGWGVSFVNMNGFSRRDIPYESIPWPKLSDAEQTEVDENYKKLHKLMGREE
jgi:hypothetical protein